MSIRIGAHGYHGKKTFRRKESFRESRGQRRSRSKRPKIFAAFALVGGVSRNLSGGHGNAVWAQSVLTV
jgi:hypothetical protein